MRRLILTRGPQGSGKSSFIRQAGLEQHLLSADVLRLMVASPVMERGGGFMVSHDHEAEVWRLFDQLLEQRLSRGETVVVDGTNPREDILRSYVDRADQHGYQVACVDFTPVPMAQCLEQNRRRPEPFRVPDAVVERTRSLCISHPIPRGILHLPWHASGLHAEQLSRWLQVPRVDLSSYHRVVHVGDLQGCITPLLGPKSPLSLGLQPDTYYIFVGDLCDRGLENGRTLRWVLDHLVGPPNVTILYGNHERHLEMYARELPVVSREFESRTQPQLLEAGLTPEVVRTLLPFLRECFFYEWRGKKVMATHAGLATVPPRPELVSLYQYTHGTGHYEEAVDEQFARYAPPDWFQVHGHRNSTLEPIQASKNAFNLEGQVEFGGSLRLLTLDERGFFGQELRNPVFRPLREYLSLPDRGRRPDEVFPRWLTEEPMGGNLLTASDFEALRGHPLIQTKTSDTQPHLMALNFTNQAFFEKAWDALTVRARGLFVDHQSREIVARSYDKFFNVGERPETDLEQLSDTLIYPVTAYVKENGFLGILGFDSRSSELLYCSKSTVDGDFALWLRDIVERQISPGRRETLRRYLRDTESSLVLEVIDPVRDPHIVEYAEQQLVVLDLVRRAARFEKLPYDRLRRLTKRFGLPVKARAAVLDSKRSLLRFLRGVNEERDYRFEGRRVEGFVLEDARGFMTKVKLPYYQHWKQMRSLKDRIRAVRGTAKPLNRRAESKEAEAFIAWCEAQPDVVLALDIITVRRLYEADRDGKPRPLVPALINAELTPPERTRADPRRDGFRRALEGLAAESWIRPKTAEDLAHKALASDSLLDELRGSSLKERLLAALPGGLRDELKARLATSVGPAARSA